MIIFQKPSPLFLTLLLISAAGCSDVNDDGPRALHPSTEFMESSLSVSVVLTGEPEGVWSPEYENQPLGYSGNINDEPRTFMSRISKVLKTSEGFMLLDEDRMQVIYMDADSSFHAVGRSGPGPGEYSTPAGIAYADGGKGMVADVMKIETFLIKDSSVEPEITIRTSVDTPSGICVMNDIIYLSGSSVTIDDDALMALMQGEPVYNPFSFISRPVHAFTMEGNSLRTFGNRYTSQSGWPTFTSYFSGQYMLCDEKRNQLYTINQKFPVLSAWSAEGEELWSVYLEDIPSLPMNEKNEGRSEMLLAEGAQDVKRV